LAESQTATIYRAFNLAILQRRTETSVLQHTFRFRDALEVAKYFAQERLGALNSLSAWRLTLTMIDSHCLLRFDRAATD
jgi:hypothetical protein